MITEADARVLEYGSTVALVAGGHVTPLAADTLKARRVSVVRESGDVDEASLAPRADIRTVAIAGDHTSLTLKAAIVQHLRGRGLAVHDLGTDSSEPVDYPDTAGAVAVQVARGEADAGIAIDGAGLGSTHRREQGRGVRAAMCTDRDAGPLRARAQRRQRAGARLHAGVDAARPSRSSTSSSARRCAKPRYIRRLAKIRELERAAAALMQPLDLAAPHPDHRRGDRGGRSRRRAPSRCACHSLLYECCPDRLRGVLDAGATRLGLHATGGAPAAWRR